MVEDLRVRLDHQETELHECGGPACRDYNNRIELSPEQELELLMVISEAIDPWWKVDFSMFSDEDLRTIESLMRKEERGEALTKGES